MAVQYSSIYQGQDLLASKSNGSLPNNVKKLMDSIAIQAKPNDLACVKFENYTSYYLRQPQSGLTIIAVSGSQTPARLIYTFLKLVDSRTRSSEQLSSKDYKNVLESVSNDIDTQSDEIMQAQEELRNVKQIMTMNIDKLLERGERVDLLVNRTSQMSQSADIFNRQTTHLQRKMWIQNKLSIFLGMVLVGTGVVATIKIL